MRRGVFCVPAAALIVALLLLMSLGGCGSGGETTVTVERTVTVATVANGSSREEKDAYIKAVGDQSTQADNLNRDYRALIEQYNNGEVTAQDLAGRADLNWRTYDDINRNLTKMKVPLEFQAAHAQLISGFNKWQMTYVAYRDGFRDNNRALLDKARDLDGQAVIEVNQAINAISQVG
ncbi:MAG: hypothetical protein ACYCXF_04745 [Thermoleophilia bacterium]